ncbi:uncharacterized protein BDV17DRAFT_131073 [Aspergillus undulatus]|uniref:uncharacterized protein n=1 Tax=Aspergillus undulatus TaxID=1810928 RepID=UPI003CCCDC4B
MLGALRQSTRLTRLGLYQARWNSTASPSVPPLMATLRTDLKTAMRAKDTDRLNIIRAIIGDYNNSQKSPNPITSDLQLLSVIRKRIRASEDAAQQCQLVNRLDLKEKEDKAQAILKEYGSHVKTLNDDEVREAVLRQITEMKDAGTEVHVGAVFKELFKQGGPLFQQPADGKKVKEIAQEAISKL